MRRLFVAVFALALALTLAGCGGGGDEQAKGGGEATQTADSGTAPAAPPGTVAEEPVVDRSPTETVLFEPFPEGSATIATITPTAILENLEANQAMLIFYHDSTQSQTDDIRDQIDIVLADYRGLIELVAFDMRKAKPGVVKTDPELEKASMIADRIGVTGTPYLLIVDRQGLITWRIRGPVDSEMLKREVIRATQ